MKKLIFFLMLLFVFCSCSAEGQRVRINQPDTVEQFDFDVVFLFEYEGLKIYRFYDGGYYRYFSIGKGMYLNQQQRHSTGKSTTIFEDGVEQLQ